MLEPDGIAVIITGPKEGKVIDGSITHVLHRTFSLEETVEAVELLGSGHAPAKLVIKP